MVIVATAMDNSTERIITYLRNTYMVDINILFFHVFSYNDKRFISRAWFAEDAEEAPAPVSARSDAYIAQVIERVAGQAEDSKVAEQSGPPGSRCIPAGRFCVSD